MPDLDLTGHWANVKICQTHDYQSLQRQMFDLELQNMIRRNQPISHCVPSLYYTTTTTTTTWSRIFKRGMGALQLICRFHLILFKWMFCHHLAIAVVYIHWKGKIRVRVEWQLGLLCYQCWQCCTDELTLPLHFIEIIQWQWIEGSKRMFFLGKLGNWVPNQAVLQ